MSTIGSFTGQWAFLSNFSPSRIVWEDPGVGPEIIYPTVEHAFQAAKTLDLAERHWISQRPTPGLAKQAGWNLRSPLRRRWKHIRVEVMCELIKLKFALGSDLAEQLMATDGAWLIEGNTWHDNFWGDCTASSPKCREDCALPGANNLGEILMTWREHLFAAAELAEASEGKIR